MNWPIENINSDIPRAKLSRDKIRHVLHRFSNVKRDRRGIPSRQWVSQNVSPAEAWGIFQVRIFSIRTRPRPNFHIKYAEFREADLFAVKIFCIPNSVPDSVSDAESHDIKILI